MNLNIKRLTSSKQRAFVSLGMTMLVLYGADLCAQSGEEPAVAAESVPSSEAAPVVAPAVMPPPVQAKESQQPVASENPVIPASAVPVVSDGARIMVDDKGFSITPPEGWEVLRDVGNAAVLLQAQKQPGMMYQRSIQVMTFEGPKFIDHTTAKEIEPLLVRKFSESSAAIDGYQIRNNTEIEMADGRKGILFYSEFKFDGVSLMQAHVLVTSKTRHYITTFTDLAEHFELEENQAYLAEAWGTMTSLELDSATPDRLDGPIMAGVAVFVISGGLGVFFLIRYQAARKRYEALASTDLTKEDALSEAPATFNSSIVTISDEALDEEEDSDGQGADDASTASGVSPISGVSRLETSLESDLDSHPESRITSKAS